MGNKVVKMYNSTKNVNTLVEEIEELKKENEFFRDRVEKLEASLKIKNESLSFFIKELCDNLDKLKLDHRDFI
jgi:uncharacterized protein YhaN